MTFATLRSISLVDDGRAARSGNESAGLAQTEAVAEARGTVSLPLGDDELVQPREGFGRASSEVSYSPSMAQDL